MSLVSNVLLTAQWVDGEAITQIADVTHQRESSRLIGFRAVGAHAGGRKCWEAETWMAAVNYLEQPGPKASWMIQLADILKDRSSGVALIIHQEHDEDDDVTVYRLLGGQWKAWPL